MRSSWLRAALAVLSLGVSAALVAAGAPAPQAHAAAAETNIVKAIGSKSAPITMEVFSDYECPSCGALYEQTLKQLISSYVAQGKVYLVHRDFPLTIHKYSRDAARWVNAAARIGRYPEAEAALYDNQAAWSADGNIQKFISAALSPADFKRVQKLMDGCESGGAAQGAHACALDASIEQDMALGHQVPVQYTPTFRIYYKGQPYPPATGAVSWPILKQFFDQLLSQ